MAADVSNGFVLNHHVYLGKETDRVREKWQKGREHFVHKRWPIYSTCIETKAKET